MRIIKKVLWSFKVFLSFLCLRSGYTKPFPAGGIRQAHGQGCYRLQACCSLGPADATKLSRPLVKDFSKVKVTGMELNSDHLWSGVCSKGSKGNRFLLRGHSVRGCTRPFCIVCTPHLSISHQPREGHHTAGGGGIWSRLLSQLCCLEAALDRPLCPFLYQ